MVSSSFLFIVVCLFFGLSLAQQQPPLLKGQYQDTVCNGVPFTPGYFEKRTVYFGDWLGDEGDWIFTQDVYASSDCSDANRLYTLTTIGEYELTGKKAQQLESFWNINYSLEQQKIRIYSAEFQNLIAESSGCAFGRVVLGRNTDVSGDRCSLLNIVPLNECPVSYDIIRREGSRIWFGSHFAGNPIHYSSSCQVEDRLTSYDHFGLGALDLYAYETMGRTSFPTGTSQTDVLNSYLNIDALEEFEESGAGNLKMFFSVTLMAALALLM